MLEIMSLRVVNFEDASSSQSLNECYKNTTQNNCTSRKKQQSTKKRRLSSYELSTDEGAACQNPRKRVRFCVEHEIQQVNNISSSMLDSDTDDIWWQRQDLRTIKLHAKTLSNAILEQKTLATHPFGYRNVLQRTYARCLHDKLPSCDDKKGLFMWVSKGHSRRGLERWSVPTIGRHRQTRREDMLHGILNAQASMKGIDVDSDLKAKILKETSERFSKASKQFAVFLGEADAYAASDSSVDVN